jgi:hypothetical protein
MALGNKPSRVKTLGKKLVSFDKNFNGKSTINPLTFSSIFFLA